MYHFFVHFSCVSVIDSFRKKGLKGLIFECLDSISIGVPCHP